MRETNKSMLSGYRVLDLTDEKGYLCGRILGDLGADVIKIERPEGDLGRRIGPFYHDIPHPEKSLFWFAYNANKRGITLNIETSDGKEIFKKLVKTADFVIESFAPGYLERLALAYSDLSQIKSDIVMTSITPFGQDGPYSTHKSCDITAMAMGGIMFLCGDADRPPVRVSVDQAYLHASAQSAGACLIAHYFRESTGEGQYVDVSIQASTVPSVLAELIRWEVERYIVVRDGASHYRTGSTYQRDVWPCKDGFVGWRLFVGLRGIPTVPTLIEWMDTEGVAGELKDLDWRKIDLSKVTEDQMNRWEQLFLDFFSKHTKEEIARKAVEKGATISPVHTVDDVVKYIQLQERGFWTEIAHSQLNPPVTYPGAFLKSDKVFCGPRRSAPSIGEHNLEIYEMELGLSRAELITLKGVGVI